MSNEVQVFFDAEGKPVVAQMSVSEYEKLVNMVKEADVAKEKLKKVMSMLQGG